MAVEVEKSNPVPDVKAEKFVTDEMKEAAAASLEKAKARSKEESGLGVLRRKGGTSTNRVWEKSEIPYPEGIHGDNYEFYGPAGMASEIPEGTEIAALTHEQEFVINPDKVKFLYFDRPGRNLPKKRLYTIKGIKPNGRMCQMGFEPQINNNAGGDPEDAIGLRRYARKGIHVLIDWDTLIPVYCGAWGCYARANQSGPWVAFCSERHARHTKPNAYADGTGVRQSLLAQGVTTSQVWSV